MNLDTIFWVIVAVAVVGGGLFYLWGRQKGNKTKFNNKKATVYGLLGLGLVVLVISPMNPWSTAWLFGLFGGSTGPGGDDLVGGEGYMKYNEEKAWTNAPICFDIINRADEDGGYASTIADSITCRVYRGTASYDNLGSLTYVETLTASSGTFTSTKEVYNSKEKLTFMFGTFNADETGNNPLKTQVCTGIVQGEDGTDKPSTLGVGIGYFEYFAAPDEDDLALNIVDEDLQDYSESTSFDWSDETDNVFSVFGRITFTDAEFGLYSYYDYSEDYWWNWYIAGYTSEDNCTASEGLVVDSTLPSGYQSAANSVNFYIQLTSPIIFTGPIDSITEITDWGYFTDVGADAYSGYDANCYVPFDIDLLSCTSGGAGDNNRELQFTFDLGTGHDVSRILNAGALLTDTDNNFNVAGSDTPYIIT